MAGALVRYGATATALLLAGWWLGRRSALGADPALGGTGVRGLDYAMDMPKLASKAAYQVGLAQRGKKLSSYTRVQGRQAFIRAPAFNVQAHYTGAFWMAVAARVLHDRLLATRAAAALAKGTALFNIPGSSFMRGSASKILTGYGETVREAGKSATGVTGGVASQIRGIVKLMGVAGSKGMVESAQTRADERAWATEASKKSVGDAVAIGEKAGHWLRAGIGLKDPRTDEDYPSWMRWAVRGAAGVAVLAALGIYSGGVRRRIGAAATHAWRALPRVAPTGAPSGSAE